MGGFRNSTGGKGGKVWKSARGLFLKVNRGGLENKGTKVTR